MIQAGGQAPLVVMNQLAPIYVAFSVPGKLLDSIRRLQRSAPLRVSATAPGATERQATVSGRLTFIDNAVDATTGTIKLKATFDNAGNRLWPGQFVDATLFLSADPQRHRGAVARRAGGAGRVRTCSSSMANPRSRCAR